MKIAHVVDCMEIGGVETLVAQMCRLQRAQGHDPQVYTVGTLGILGKQMLEEGYSVRAQVGRHLVDSARNFLSIFKEFRPDVVHLHNPTPAFYAGPGARLAGVPCIVSTRHGLVAPPRRFTTELKYAFAAVCCDWIVGVCDATVANLQKLYALPARKIVRVFNGTTPLSRVEKDQCPTKGGFTLLYVGRLAPVKNHTLLLQAFRAARTSISNLRLWIVGDGSERQMLERLARDTGIGPQVTFWGQQLDVAPYFSAADAFIMSSNSEGLPVSLLQAFSLGLPAIVTDVGGMSEAVRHAQAGLIVPGEDPAALSAAIVHLAKSDSDRQRYSQNALASFNARFTLDTMVSAYSELYRTSKRHPDTDPPRR